MLTLPLSASQAFAYLASEALPLFASSRGAKGLAAALSHGTPKPPPAPTAPASPKRVAKIDTVGPLRDLRLCSR
jgi:hypothetical protein